MAILNAENWYPYGGNTAFLLNGVYAQTDALALVADPDGVSTGLVASCGTDGRFQTANLRYPLPATAITVGQAMRVWPGSLPSIANFGQTPFEWRDASNNPIVSILIGTTGSLQVWSGEAPPSGFGTLLGETPGPVITANAWWHIEAKAVISTTVGEIEVRVEGVPVLHLTGLNLGSTPVAQVQLSNLASGTGLGFQYFVKDWVTWDGSGTHNTDFLGSVLVYSLLPTADVSFNWNTTGPNGFSILDNSPPLDDAAYISADLPLPAASTFTMSDLPSNVTSVRALITETRAKKVDGGDGNLQTSLISGATTGNGADRPITAAYTYWRDVFEVDPNTSNQWTISAVNAINLKINRTV